MFAFNWNNILTEQYCYILLSTTVAHLIALSFTGESTYARHHGYNNMLQRAATYAIKIHHLPWRRDTIHIN